jgi:CDP-glucose 4,6-dehydratase
MVNSNFWRNRATFVTGHTGFKGGWVSHWLSDLGAKVHGYSLEPPTKTNFFTEVRLRERVASSTFGDVRDLDNLSRAIKTSHPEVIFHLAAQPLVRQSYLSPIETFATNVMGSVNVLEAAKRSGSVKAIVIVTTDKCYANNEWPWAYRENDRLGGHDPYSASKACTEIAVAAYRTSFFAEAGIHVASARAGNVIGGGDWATDRLIPDFFRAIDEGLTLKVRSPNAVRPWQHVLEPLSGYLMLAERLSTEDEGSADAWNFGPNDEDAKPVSWVLERLSAETSGARWEIEKAKQPHEAGLLKLDSSKARFKLGWLPQWNLEKAITKTAEWQRAWHQQKDMAAVTTEQIREYIAA